MSRSLELISRTAGVCLVGLEHLQMFPLVGFRGARDSVQYVARTLFPNDTAQQSWVFLVIGLFEGDGDSKN